MACQFQVNLIREEMARRRMVLVRRQVLAVSLILFGALQLFSLSIYFARNYQAATLSRKLQLRARTVTNGGLNGDLVQNLNRQSNALKTQLTTVSNVLKGTTSWPAVLVALAQSAKEANVSIRRADALPRGDGAVLAVEGACSARQPARTVQNFLDAVSRRPEFIGGTLLSMRLDERVGGVVFDADLLLAPRDLEPKPRPERVDAPVAPADDIAEAEAPAPPAPDADAPKPPPAVAAAPAPPEADAPVPAVAEPGVAVSEPSETDPAEPRRPEPAKHEAAEVAAAPPDPSETPDHADEAREAEEAADDAPAVLVLDLPEEEAAAPDPPDPAEAPMPPHVGEAPVGPEEADDATAPQVLVIAPPEEEEETPAAPPQRGVIFVDPLAEPPPPAPPLVILLDDEEAADAEVPGAPGPAPLADAAPASEVPPEEDGEEPPEAPAPVAAEREEAPLPEAATEGEAADQPPPPPPRERKHMIVGLPLGRPTALRVSIRPIGDAPAHLLIRARADRPDWRIEAYDLADDGRRLSAELFGEGWAASFEGGEPRRIGLVITPMGARPGDRVLLHLDDAQGLMTPVSVEGVVE